MKRIASTALALALSAISCTRCLAQAEDTLEKAKEQFNTAAKTGNDELFGQTLFESNKETFS